MLLKMAKILTYVMSFVATLERMVTRYMSELGWTNKGGQSMEPLRFQELLALQGEEESAEFHHLQ